MASPFLVIAVLCDTLRDVNKIEAQWTPFLNAGRIEWDGGSIPILHASLKKILILMSKGVVLDEGPGTLRSENSTAPRKLKLYYITIIMWEDGSDATDQTLVQEAK
jgi:hypothetical protein